MSAVAQISPVAVVAPVYQIERTTDLSMAQFLDQIKSLLSNDFFAPVITPEQWASKALIGTDLDQICQHLSDSAYTFNDLTGEVTKGSVLGSQVLIALNNTLAPLLNSDFADLPHEDGVVKVKVDNHVNYGDVQAIPGRPGYFTKMISDVTFAMPVHNPVETCSKSQPTAMHLNLTFTIASEINLVTGKVVFKTHDDDKALLDFENIGGHFKLAVKSEHSFEPKGHPSINLNIIPLFFGLRFLESIETRIHNMVALRILKNQDDFSKLLAKHRFK